MKNTDLDWESAREAAEDLDRRIDRMSPELRNRWEWLRPRIEGQLLAISKHLRELHRQMLDELDAETQPLMKLEHSVTQHPIT